MNGWTWAALAVAIQIAGATLMSLALRHGEQQARAARAARHTPAWARTDHHNNGRHRR